MTETDNKENSAGVLCPYLTTCAMIQPHQDRLVGLIDRFKENYCFKGHKGCARRWVKDFLGAKKVPELMMPQQHDWAEQLLFEAGVGYTDFREKYSTLWRNADKE